VEGKFEGCSNAGFEVGDRNGLLVDDDDGTNDDMSVLIGTFSLEWLK